MALDPRAAVAKLREIEHRSIEQEPLIPSILVKGDDWQGLAFTLDGVRVVSVMTEIRELLPYPESVTRVPGTKSWMLGLANIRGELLSIVDLQQFVGGNPITINDQCRILVIRNKGMSTGLLVSSVLGMRHFPLSKQIRDAEIEGPLGRYVYDVFKDGDEIWPVFSMAALANDEHFLSAAL